MLRPSFEGCSEDMNALWRWSEERDTLSNHDYDSMETSALIAMAKIRRLIDEAERDELKYKIIIGVGSFEFEERGTREFLMRLLRNYSGDQT